MILNQFDHLKWFCSFFKQSLLNQLRSCIIHHWFVKNQIKLGFFQAINLRIMLKEVDLQVFDHKFLLQSIIQSIQSKSFLLDLHLEVGINYDRLLLSINSSFRFPLKQVHKIQELDLILFLFHFHTQSQGNFIFEFKA